MLRRTEALAFLLVLAAALIAGVPHNVQGQSRDGGTELIENVSLKFLIENVVLRLDVRPGTELEPGDDLGMLLAKRIRVSSNEDGKPVQLGF